MRHVNHTKPCHPEDINRGKWAALRFRQPSQDYDSFLMLEFGVELRGGVSL